MNGNTVLLHDQSDCGLGGKLRAISFGRFSMYSRFDGSAAAAARGLLWPA
jgi:hypothetical protein